MPDVSINESFGPAVYKLYRSGILTRDDKYGTFNPNNYILRKKAAAITTRMVDPSLRKPLKLTKSLSAEELFNKCSPAVFIN